MSSYTLLDTTVSFSASDDRFWNLQYKLWTRMDAAGRAFEQWYRTKGGAEEALKGCERIAAQFMEQYWAAPFMAAVADYQIADIDTAVFQKQCLDLTALRQVAQTAGGVLDRIEKEYREKDVVALLETACNAPAAVNDMVGALKDPAAIAAGLDAPDCMVESPGRELDREISPKPVFSEYARRKNLYRHMGGFLRRALENGMRESTNRLIQLVNKHWGGFITAPFSYAKSQAELLRAEAGEELDKAAVLAAFAACPWSREFYDFAFDHFTTQRGALFQVAGAFHVDMGPRVEDILADMYQARESDATNVLKPLREEMLKVMKNYGVTESQTLEELEFRMLENVTAGLESADRKTCHAMLREISKQNVSERTKSFYTKKVNERIASMIEAKNGESMDAYLKRCNILDPAAVKAAQSYVQEQCPEESRALYLTAFRAFNMENIRKGRKYQPMSEKDFASYAIRYIGFFFIAAGLLLLASKGYFRLLSIPPVVLGVVLQVRIFSWRRVWNDMTLHGAVVHPAFKVDKEAFRRMCAVTEKLKKQKARQEQTAQSAPAQTAHTNKGFYD